MAIAMLTLSSWTSPANAQGELPAPVYPVVHDKAWYDNPENVAPFQWKDQEGNVHWNKVSDPATNPLHIIALLSYVYTNPKIPGMKYAIPDSAGMGNIYRYIPDPSEFGYNGFGDHGYTLDGFPVRTNNLSTIVDYTRHVRDDRYTGDITPETPGRDYAYELSLDANRNGMQLWAINNPFFRTENAYNNATGQYENLPVVDQPYEHGLTVFLVKMKDTYEYKNENGAVSSVLGNQNHQDREINQYGVVNSLYNSIDNEIESIRLITNSVRVEDDDSKQYHNTGTLYSVTEPNVNRFYFIAKGTPRQSVKMPTKPLFEEFSPISSLLNGWEMNFYNELMQGKVFTMQHDCSSVPEQAHAFSMHGLNPAMTTHRDLTGVTLWIPDYRMEYWEYGTYKQQYGYDPESKEGFGRDLFKRYAIGSTNPNKKEVWRVIRYFNYNPMHMPTLALYTCKLQADAQPNTTQEHTYDVTLDWSTTVSKIAGSNEAIPEDFVVYRVVNGVREESPLFTFVYDEDGYCQIKYNNSDLSQGETPSSRSRTYEHIYQVPQNKDEGYWITYQVFARVHKANGEMETFASVLSNTDRVWIPPYDAPTPVQLNIELNTSSEYIKEREVNRYVNTIKISNDEINPLKLNQVQARYDNMGWNPNANGGEGGFEVANGADWKWEDNELCSEIIVYRFNRDNPDDKVKVAQVKFHTTNANEWQLGAINFRQWFRFDVRRFNQAESATHEEYVYKDGYTHPWTQSCDTYYNIPSNQQGLDNLLSSTSFSFANHGYPLGLSDDQKNVGAAGQNGGDYQKGIMITDIFEASTMANDHPEHYGYIAEFHKYINDTDPRFPSETSYSNKAFIDVYKSIGESSEFNFTKDEIDNNDAMHELELGYKAGLTVNNMLYLPEIYRYDIFSRTLGEYNALSNTVSVAQVNSYAERDTHNTYLVYSLGNKVGEPEQYQSAVTIPDKGRQKANMDAMYYVPVITAKLPDRAVWMANGDNVAWKSSTYGSDYHGTANTLVWLENDTKHKLYETYLKAYLGLGENEEPTEEQLCNGSDIEHAETASGQHYYGHFMQVKSEMSPNLEVYGVRIWRVRPKDDKGTPEDVLVKEWFKGQDMDLSSSMPQPGYFVVSNASDGTINVALKDIYKGPAPATLSSDVSYQPTYIVHFYGRMKPTTASMLKTGTDDQAKVYYASEQKYLPTIPNEIPTGIGSTMLAKHVVNVKYFDTMGRMSDSPFKGINIVETHYDDGSTTTTKLVK